MSERIRVLVVDDSAFARQVVRRVLERALDIDIVDIARDGAEALEKAALLRPDVITLDLVMPNVDGLGVLAALPPDGPRVVVVSSAGADTEIGAAALAAGAVDLVHKPTTLATDRLYEMADELIERVRVAARARPLAAAAAAPLPARVAAPSLRAEPRFDLVLVGTSTGGPQALARILPQFPRDYPVPIAVVVHLPPGYSGSLARRLDAQSSLTVLEAHDGLVLTRGMAVIAPHGANLVIERDAVGLRARLDYLPRPGELHKPSIDALFESAAASIGERVLAVVLTGMGEDGLRGARALTREHATVVAQDEATSVVWGMPRSVSEAGLASEVAPLHRMVEVIRRRVGV